MMDSMMEQLDELRIVLEQFRKLLPLVDASGRAIVDCLKKGGRLFTCGNGGSAADALHLAEELTGRYLRERRSLSGISLAADVTALTCIANDYGYDAVFSRQLEGLGRKGDVLVGFSTSGNSVNVLRAIEAGKRMGVITILLAGKDGGASRGKADHEIIIPSDTTARIQEVHTFILHQWLEMVEREDWGETGK